jgi:hypothetical protein
VVGGTEAGITVAEWQRIDSAAKAMHYPYVSNVSTPLALRSVGEGRWQTRQAKETQATCKGLASVGATVDLLVEPVHFWGIMRRKRVT